MAGAGSKLSGSVEGGVMNRRCFLARCGACAGCAAMLGGRRLSAAQPTTCPAPTARKSRVRLVFSHRPAKEITWPYVGFDYDNRIRMIQKELIEACPEVEFLPVRITTKEEAQKILEADGEVDGYVIYMVGLDRSAWPIGLSGRPVVLVDDMYSGTGTFLFLSDAMRDQGMPATSVSSSRMSDVADAVRCLDAVARMRRTVVLDVLDRWNPEGWRKAIRETMGAEVKMLTAEDLDAAYEQADVEEGKFWAKRWIDGADQIIEPTREEIEKSGRMYVGMSDLMRKYGARAITIDCLGLFYAGRMKAYPCLGFFQMNNDSLVGACEADLRSTTTMLLMTYATGRPGFISDPVVDMGTNRVIYAHCVAPNKVFGPSGSANPYRIRSHSEDRKGAAVQSIMPVGEMTTTLEFDATRKQTVFHHGPTVANVEEDRACRTKLAVQLPDAGKLVKADWGSTSWHRVTFYGDLRRQVGYLNDLLKFKCIEEA